MRLIDADAAIEMVCEEVMNRFFVPPSTGYNVAEEALKKLPSVQPEYPKGRWIPIASGKGRHECSRCHEYAPCYQDGSEHLSTFCVLCGAKMEEGE